MTRADAIEIVKAARDGAFPWTYLGKPLKDILEPLDMSVDEFRTVCVIASRTGRSSSGRFRGVRRDRHDNLEKTNYDNP